MLLHTCANFPAAAWPSAAAPVPFFPERPFVPGSHSELSAGAAETACWWAHQWARHRGWKTLAGRFEYDAVWQCNGGRERASADYLWRVLIEPWLKLKAARSRRK